MNARRRLFPFALAPLLAIGLAPSTLAQVPSDRAAEPFPELAERAGGTWVAHWNPATGTPSAVYGTGLPLRDWREDSVGEARRHAQWTLATFGDLLGLGASEFREVVGARMGGSWAFVFDQYFRGLPVIGGRADVRIHGSGVLSMLGSKAWPVPPGFDTTPRIGEDTARARAWLASGQEPTGVRQPGVEHKPRLVIWGDVFAAAKAPFHLAWEIPIRNVDAGGRGPIGCYYVDAGTGAILHYRNDKHECGRACAAGCRAAEEGAASGTAAAPAAGAMPVPTTVTIEAWTRTGESGVAPLALVPVPNLELNIPGVGTFVTDANGQFTMDIAAPVTVNVGRLDGTHCSPVQGQSPPNASQVVQPGVNTAIQVLTSASGPSLAAHTTAYWWTDRVNEWVRTILGPLPVTSFSIDDVTPAVNQTGSCNAFYNNNSINFYPAGNGCNNTAFSTVIAHEWGHGLDDLFGGISNNPGDGLSEGWGDILGMYLVDSPIVGLDFNTTNTALRTGLNNRTYPPPQEVHDAGEVFMGFGWRVRANLRTLYPGPGTQATSISNTIVVGSIVADANTQPEAVREVFLADDNDGNMLNGTPHYAQLEAAAQAKNLPYPLRQSAMILHRPLASTTSDVEPRLAVATALPFTGSIGQVRLHYRLGGAPAQVRGMFPTGAPNEYRALLPGVSHGTTVTYHFEAVHSSSAVIRQPAAGEYAYRVSPDEFLFTEDFESGAAGWTHGLVQNEDDWGLGTPTGRSGPGWSDPSTAASGVACYGNDIGQGTGDGAYSNDVQNHLRSPTIDCTGKFGVRLRFKRWLTVEPGDQAEIFVGTTRAWGSSPTTGVSDSSWQIFEVPIPAADDNPSAVIEWRLTTNNNITRGGWNIDDVELFVPGFPFPRVATLTILPEQAQVGTPVVLQLGALPSNPALIVFGSDGGPLAIPGIPELKVGGLLASLFVLTDGAGQVTINLAGPPAIVPTGIEAFLHALTFDQASNLIASNPTRVYFTP